MNWHLMTGKNPEYNYEEVLPTDHRKKDRRAGGVVGPSGMESEFSEPVRRSKPGFWGKKTVPVGGGRMGRG